MKKIKNFLVVSTFFIIISLVLSFNAMANENNQINVPDSYAIIVSNYDDLLLINNSMSIEQYSVVGESIYYEPPHTDLENIFTTSNLPITCAILYNSDFNEDDALRKKEEFEEENPTFIEIYENSGMPTTKFNCHAYAWYGATVEEPCWIRYPDEFFDDPHCDDTITEHNAQIGDIVVFKSYTKGSVHSAVISGFIYENGVPVIECVSKFHEMGIYKHKLYETAEVYEYNYCDFYRYNQGQHFYEWTSVNNTQHQYKCSVCPATMSGVFNHTNQVTGTYTESGHSVYCSGCGYSGTEEHDFYIYQDNGESGITIKCNLCGFVKSCNIGVAEYVYGGQDGHYVDCSCGCYSFFAAHVPSIIMQTSSLSYHNALCKYCGEIYPAAHSWVPKNYGYVQGYECLMCDMFSISIPGVMQIPPSDELLIATSDDLVTEDALLPEKEDDLVTE